MVQQALWKFETVEEASAWAQENNISGAIIIVRIDGKWVAHMVEDDYSITPICDCNGEMVVVDIYDGGDTDGYADHEMSMVHIYDGGGPSGI
jgi:hypothetical protein